MDMGDAPLIPARVDGLEGGLAIGVGHLDATAEYVSVEDHGILEFQIWLSQ